MKGITNFDSSYPRKKVIKYEIKSSREFEVRYLQSLYKSGYKIIDPIETLVENPKTKEDEYIIEIEEGDVFIYSNGKTLNEAIKRIRCNLIELYEELINKPDNDLGIVLNHTKEYIKKHIIKENNK